MGLVAPVAAVAPFPGDGPGPVCTQCGRPGGNEVAFGDGPSVRLHRGCEDAFIDRRMGEEGVA